jgi:magnesium transporter
MQKIIDKIFKPKYPKDSVGRLMTTEVPTALKSQTISDIFDALSIGNGFETINYIYITDQDKKLEGVLSLKEIFLHPKEKKIEELFITDLVTIGPYADQERAAIIALKHNLKAIPVVDKKSSFLGVMCSDTILDVLNKENIEDFLLGGGFSKMEANYFNVLETPAFRLFKARFSWLLIGLFGGIIAAQVMGFFESVLKQEILLAFFVPVIVYMSDAVAHQTQTIFIRGMVMNNNISLSHYLKKEIKIGFFLALFLGSILGLVAKFWWQSQRMAYILFFSIFFGIILSISTGVLIPWLLKKARQDPAIGSGPFATIIVDILSIVVYFLVSTALIRVF